MFGSRKPLEAFKKRIFKTSHQLGVENEVKSTWEVAQKIIDSAVSFKATAEASKLFTTPQRAIGHYAKHEKSLKTALGKDAYSFGEFMADANHVVKEGTY